MISPLTPPIIFRKTTNMLDIDFVRSQFPAFADPSLQGWSFFENAGGSYACGAVDYYTKTKVQPYAPYAAAQRAGEQMDESYVRLAQYLNVAVDAVHFGPSTSQNTYVLAQAFRAGWREDDEVIVTNQDHEANSGVWRRLVDTGIKVRQWNVDPDTGQLNIDDLATLINERTKLLAFPHCSNIVAHINSVREICTLARAAGVVTVVDGVSYAGHGFADLTELGCDVYLFSLYKTYGPHQGLMVVQEPVRSQLANQGHFFNNDEVRKRLVPAGPDHAQIAAAAGIADYFDALVAHHHDGKNPTAATRQTLVHRWMREHEKQLLQPLLDYFSGLNRVRVLGPVDAEVRAPTLALDIGTDVAAFAKKLAAHKVMCSSGHFYAHRLVEALGINTASGVLRLSFVHYTSQQDVDQLMTAFDTVLNQT